MRINDAYAIRLLFEDWRFGALPGARLLLQPADEGPEGKPAARIGLSREFRDAMQIGQTARAALVESDGSVGANRVQQLTNGFGDGVVVALAVQLADDREGLPDRLEFRIGAFGRLRSRPEPAVPLFEAQQSGIVDAEERAAQQGVDAQLVVGPLDGAQCGAYGGRFFALVQSLGADEDVLDFAGFETADVVLGEVPVVIQEPAEQNADVFRLDGAAAAGCIGADRPAAGSQQPLDEGGNRGGRAFEDRFGPDLLALVRPRHRQRHNGGLAVGTGRSAGERQVIGNCRRECRVDESLDRLRGAIAVAKQPLFGARGEKPLANLEIGARIGAAEAIDTLFGISDDE